VLAVACVLLGFLAVVAARSRPANPASRLPRQYELAGLIQRQQASAQRLRRQVDDLRSQVDRLVSAGAKTQAAAASRKARLSEASLAAGLVPVRGAGLRITLDDSTLAQSPEGNVNDLVIHSQDVQAAVNAAWRSGAEAISINDQRLVGTSAVLCVGNTLLLNGTVHSPPYVIEAVGAGRDRLESDPLFRRLRADAEAFGLRVKVERDDSLDVAAYKGKTTFKFAQPAA
jgi:uncharacterized protein YlxW (UPF0749 family)